MVIPDLVSYCDISGSNVQRGNREVKGGQKRTIILLCKLPTKYVNPPIGYRRYYGTIHNTPTRAKNLHTLNNKKSEYE
jgi:hypothetical protein